MTQPPIRRNNGWAHQLEAYDFAMKRLAADRDKAGRCAMLAMEMGTGKSWVAIAVAENLEASGNVPLSTLVPMRVLVLCPKAVLGVWRREFERHAAKHWRMMILDDGTAMTKSHRVGVAQHTTGNLVVVVNYDVAWRAQLGKVLSSIGWDLVIMDESHRIKSPTGRASRFCHKLAGNSYARLALTGTPMPHSPMDLYAQFRALDSRVFGTSLVRFRNNYAITDRMFPSRVLKWIRQDDMRQRFESIAHQVGAEVLDLPGIMHETIPVVLPAARRREYDELDNEFVAEVEAGTITAANAMVKATRLQQYTSGFGVVAGDMLHDEPRTVRVHDAKHDALQDWMGDLPHNEPVVVFCRYARDLAVVAAVAMSLGRVYGEISGRRRDLTPHATWPDGVQVMGVQWQAGGVGIDLTAAAYAVVYSSTFSLGDYDQAMARLHRPGQTRPVRVYTLEVERSIDSKIARAIGKKRDVIEELLDRRETCGISH